MERILVVGATGNMGRYVVADLLERGFKVAGITMDDVTSQNENLTYFKANWCDDNVVKEFTGKGYDAIIDFMHYQSSDFEKRIDMLLGNTKHFIFLSSYRVYANEQVPVTETAPHLLDALDDEEYFATQEYALEKTRAERILENSKYDNWTIVRPAIVISSKGIKLINLEVGPVLNRAAEGKPTLLPIEAKKVRAGLIWAGDAGKMISRLVLNDKAYKEAFTLGNGEEITWEEVVGYFQEIVGLIPIWISKEDHINKIMAPEYNDYQISHWRGLKYDRLFDRFLDNTKVLNVCGLKKSELKTVREAYEYELSKCLKTIQQAPEWMLQKAACDRMDDYVKEHNLV